MRYLYLIPQAADEGSLPFYDSIARLSYSGAHASKIIVQTVCSFYTKNFRAGREQMSLTFMTFCLLKKKRETECPFYLLSVLGILR